MVTSQRAAVFSIQSAKGAVRTQSWWARAVAAVSDAVVIGSREGVGATRDGEPWYRHLMGRVFNLIIHLVAIRGINDTQCGFKALRHDAAHDIFQRVRIYGDDAPVVQGAAVTAYDVEVLLIAQRRGYKIAEVPVSWHFGEETKVNPISDSLRNLRDVLRVRFNDLRGQYRDLPVSTGSKSKS